MRVSHSSSKINRQRDRTSKSLAMRKCIRNINASGMNGEVTCGKVLGIQDQIMEALIDSLFIPCVNGKTSAGFRTGNSIILSILCNNLSSYHEKKHLVRSKIRNGRSYRKILQNPGEQWWRLRLGGGSGQERSGDWEFTLKVNIRRFASGFIVEVRKRKDSKMIPQFLA